MLLSPLFSLLAICTILFSCDASTLQKRGKKGMKQSKQSSLDDDDAFLDSQIKLNDIRTHYNVALLDPEIYLSTLEKAYDYVCGIVKGMQLESESWLETIKRNPREVMTGTSSSSSDNREEFILLQSLSIATSQISMYSLYKTALENLIRHGKPHHLFYELIANIYVDNSITRTEEYVINFSALVLFDKPLSKFKKVSHEKITNGRTIVGFFFATIELDLTASDFLQHLDRATAESGPIYESEIELTGTPTLSTIVTEILTKMRLYSILFPLIKHNKPFLVKLREQAYQTPSMKRYKKTGSSNALLDLISDFHNSIKNRFMSENIFHFEVLFFAQPLVAVIHVFNATLIEEQVNVAIAAHRVQLDDTLVKLAVPLFQSDSLAFDTPIGSTAFTNRSLTPEYTLSASRPLAHLNISDIPLEPAYARTLDILINSSSKDELEALKWQDCEELILAMNGFATSLGGNVKMISLPGNASVPIRFNQPPSGSNMLMTRAMTLRRIVLEFLGS